MADAPAGVPPHHLARHGVLYTVGVVVQGTATVLVLPFVTRLLGVQEYGKVAVGLAIIQVGAVFAAAGLPAAITRAHFDLRGGPQRARAMTGMAAGLGVGVAVLAVALRPVTGDVVALSLGAVGAMVLVVAGQAVLRAQGRPAAFVLTAVGATAGAHLVGLGVATTAPTATAYLGGYVVGAVVTAALTMLLAPPLPPWRVPEAVREGLRIGLPVIPHTGALLVIANGDPLLVNHLLGPAEAGRYQAAMMLGMAPLAVLAGVNNAWAPAIMGAAEGERWTILARTMRPVVLVGAICAIGLALVAPVAVRVLVAPEFGHATLTRLVQIISASALAYVAYLGATSVIFNQKRTTPLAISTPLAAAVFLVIAVPLVTSFGIVGMAAAKVGGYIVLAVATAVAARTVADVPWGSRRWLPLAVAAVAVVLGLLAVPTDGPAVWVQLGLAVLLAVAAGLLLSRHFRTTAGGASGSAPPLARPR